MVYKKYYINIVIRAMLILANALLFSFLMLYTSYLYSIVFVGFLFFFQVYLLIRYLNQTNVFLERFLSYLHENNTSIDFSQSLKNSPFEDLSDYLKEINQIIQDALIEKENQYLYLNHLFHHVDIGLIIFDKKHHVQLINEAALQLLNIERLIKIKDLNSVDTELVRTIYALQPGKQKILPLNLKGKPLKLSLKIARFKSVDQEVTLLSLQDIKPALDQKEIDSWQKLNRVLTHEIMNSVSPIIGLSGNINQLLFHGKEAKKGNELKDRDIEQVGQSVEIIEERSKGLREFVNKFRSITSKLKPEFTEVNLLDFFEGVSLFMYDVFQHESIEFRHHVDPEELTGTFDRRLMEQVLINLLKNSVEGLRSTVDKKILLTAGENEHHGFYIRLEDNGEGIPPDRIDLIFTPFFTTKKEGSGIGLSITRNILEQHGFSLTVSSVPGVSTVFRIDS